MKNSRVLYDVMAADYDASYAAPTHRRAYDLLAWERIHSLLPPPPAVIIDVGCGTGRSLTHLLPRGYQVIALEQSTEMLTRLAMRGPHPNLTVIPGDMETIDLSGVTADVVLALGSIQYAARPDEMLKRIRTWLTPKGILLLYVDSILALIVELLRSGRVEEALECLKHRRGKIKYGAATAELQLFDADSLMSALSRAGFINISIAPLGVNGLALGRSGLSAAMKSDEGSTLALERHLAELPLFSDCGLHLFAFAQSTRCENVTK